LNPSPLSRRESIHKLLDDRISFRSHEAVAISKLATAG
jgi:hypothetical protein